MLIHDKIRQEIVDLIRSRIPNAPRIYNGRSIFTNLREELPAICVYVDDIERDFKVLGESEFQASLSISVFMPFTAGESKIDELAEQIDQLITFSNYQNIEYVRGSSYGYDYDDAASWMNGTLVYSIDYGRTAIK